MVIDNSTIDSIVSELSARSQAVDEDEIREEVEQYAQYFNDRGRVLDQVAKKLTLYDNEEVPVGGITEDGTWYDFEAQVVDLWEPRSESVRQVGLLADGEDAIKFTIFQGDDLPELEEDESYRIENAKGDEYEGDVSVIFNGATEILALEDELDVSMSGADERTVSGVIMGSAGVSGLVERCAHEDDNGDECGRVITSRSGPNECNEHPKADSYETLRFMGHLEGGDEGVTVMFGEEEVTEATGLTVEQANEIATEAMDREATEEWLLDELQGRHIEVTGPAYGDDDDPLVIANEVVARDAVGLDEVDGALISLRA